MKRNLPAIIVFICAGMLLNSCAVSKSSGNIQKSETGIGNESSSTCYVQLNDGTIQQYSSLKLVTGVLTTPHLLADNKTVLNSKDIMAYQDSRYYAVSAKIITTNKKSKVAVEALPGFAVRVVTGKVNVYSRKYYNGSNTVEEYFLQQGKDGFIVSYSKDVLKSMLKEDSKALEYFNSRSKVSPRSRKMLATVEMYNNGQLFTKN